MGTIAGFTIQFWLSSRRYNRDRNGQRINHYNINDKIYPWQNEADSKTVGDMLDYRKLDYRYER